MQRGFLAAVAVMMAMPAAVGAQMRPNDEQRRRDQIQLMEGVLSRAVRLGAEQVNRRMQSIDPTISVITGQARARGFVLEGYGVFFDVSVPSFDASMTWSLRTLDQNDLGLDSALKAIQTYVKNSGDVNLEQALRRVELQVNPATLARSATPQQSGGRTVTASAASTPAAPPPTDPVLADPDEAYRTEVLQALKDAMLDHSSSLGIGPTEWLTIAAKGNYDRPRLAPADTDSRTRLIRLRGSDLAAFLARQITSEEALQRIEVRVF